MILADTHNVTRTILKKGDFGNHMLKKIAELEARSGVRLGLAQRILLAETGTVEQILSILTGSAVRVKIVEQKENARTITRRSLIVNDSGGVLVRAHSEIFIRNLPAKVTSRIRRQESGIGTIITSCGLETFRKIVEIGYDPENRFVFRRYQIIYRKKVAFEIKEELVGMKGESGDLNP